MKKKLFSKVAVITAMVMVLLTGCGKGNTSDADKSSNNAGAATENAGGETSTKHNINIAVDSIVTTLDNNMADLPVDLTVIGLLQDSLYGRMPDGTIDFRLAESVDISNGNKTYTFHLKDATYSNGDPITAYDFVYSWKRLVNPDTGSEYAWFAGAAGIENADEIAYNGGDLDSLGVKAIDDKTLEVTLDREVPYFKNIVATPAFAPVQEKFAEAQGDQYGLSKENIISSGAFVIDEWIVGGSEIKLRKNENYWDADNIQVDTLVFQTASDSQTGVLGFESGTLDVVELTGEQSTKYADSPALQKEILEANVYLWLNTLNDDLANVNLRRAISYSINKTEISDNILKDGSIAADYFVPDEFAPDDKGVPYHQTTNLKYQSYDPEKAKEYWETAKGELGKDKLEFEFLYDDRETSKNIAQYLKSTIEETLPGITISLREVPFSACWEELKAGNFDLGVYMWGADYVDPSIFFDVMVSTSEYNHGTWVNEEYDRLNEEAAANASDYAKRYEIFNQMEQIIIDDVGNVPLYQMGKTTLIRENIHIPFNAIYLYQYATFDE